MPIPAVIAAAARVALAATSSAVRATAAGLRAGGGAIASAARAFARAGASFSRSVARLTRKAIEIARRGGSAFVNRARRAFSSLYRRIQNALADVATIARRIATTAQKNFSRIVSHIDYRMREHDIAKNLIRYFRSATQRSGADFAELLEEMLEDRDSFRKQVKLNYLRTRGLMRFTALLEEVAAGKFQTPEEALAEFFDRIEPVMSALRVVETGDPTVVVDADVESRLVEMAAMFMDFMTQVDESPLQIASMAEMLADEMMRDVRISGFRALLASQVLRDRVFTDSGEATIAAIMRDVELMSDDVLSEVEWIADSIRRAPLGTLLSNIIRVIGAASQAAATGLSRMLAALGVESLRDSFRNRRLSVQQYLDSLRRFRRAVADVTGEGEEPPVEVSLITLDDEMAHRVAEETHDPLVAKMISDVEREPADVESSMYGSQEEDDAEDNVIYGIWVRNARRTVERSCSDCEALEMITSLKPIPITELPTPGVETECGQNCACAVEEVSGDEFVELYKTWQSVYREVFESELPESPEDLSPALIPALLHMVLKDYQSGERWLKRLDIL